MRKTHRGSPLSIVTSLLFSSVGKRTDAGTAPGRLAFSYCFSVVFIVVTAERKVFLCQCAGRDGQVSAGTHGVSLIVIGMMRLSTLQRRR